MWKQKNVVLVLLATFNWIAEDFVTIGYSALQTILNPKELYFDPGP